MGSVGGQGEICEICEICVVSLTRIMKETEGKRLKRKVLFLFSLFYISINEIAC